MSKPGSQNFKKISWQIVGSTKFGRYPKISHEQTFNMIRADDFLVDYAGYKNILSLPYLKYNLHLLDSVPH